MRRLRAGSPPHTRGILICAGRTGGYSGFTPAYAGNTATRAESGCSSWVHPRIRGEYSAKTRLWANWRGSPPHTRGIHDMEIAQARMGGFTPAYAGNTLLRYYLLNKRKVHPRIRGEYSHGKEFLSSREGSPPHTRGIHDMEIAQARMGGFTPAYAGNTLLRYYLLNKRKVHPRIRGEYTTPVLSTE